MSREFYDTMASYHRTLADQFARNADGKKRIVKCRCTDQIYVYLYEDGAHIQTQHVDIPARWMKHWPADSTVRRRVRSYADIGTARIVTVDA